jgi:DNA-binding PadR family transcriptional regulator
MARKPIFGPAFDPEVLILSSLAENAKHGYAIMLDIAAFSGVEIGPGTLYTAITRLVENGWIKPLNPTGRQRPYRLTAAGAHRLRQQLAQMRRLATVGLGRLAPA